MIRMVRYDYFISSSSAPLVGGVDKDSVELTKLRLEPEELAVSVRRKTGRCGCVLPVAKDAALALRGMSVPLEPAARVPMAPVVLARATRGRVCVASVAMPPVVAARVK